MVAVVLNFPDEEIEAVFGEMLDGSLVESLNLKEGVTQEELNIVTMALVKWYAEGRLLSIVDAAMEHEPDIFKPIVE